MDLVQQLPSFRTVVYILAVGVLVMGVAKLYFASYDLEASSSNFMWTWMESNKTQSDDDTAVPWTM